MKETETRFTTDALVIKEMNVGESDRLVTLFTREHGLIRAFAAGAKSIRSKKGAATSLLTYGSFTVLKKKDTYKIYEAVPIRMFFTMGGDIELLSLEQYFCELALVFAPYDSADTELLRLILNSLHFLTAEKRFPPLIKAVTELRAASISGFMPDLVACGGCGKYEDDIMYFDIEEGCIYCKDCYRNNALTAPLGVVTAMRYICLTDDVAKVFSFKLSDENIQILSDITEKYLLSRVDTRLTTLEFYKGLF